MFWTKFAPKEYFEAEVKKMNITVKFRNLS